MRSIAGNNYSSILIAPIYEEIAFRKIFYDATFNLRNNTSAHGDKQNKIDKINIVILIALNTLIFYFSHPIKKISILVISIILSLSYLISRKIEKSIFLHGIYNTLFSFMNFL